MGKAPLLVLLAVAAGFGGGFLARFLDDDAPRVRREAPPVSVAPPAEADREWRRDLEARLRALEDIAAASPARSGPPAAPSDPAADEEAPRQPEREAPQDPLEGILGKPFDNTAANTLFWRLQQRPERMDAVIARLKKEAEENPNDPEVQVALATAYVAKLTTMPPGPQQGLVWTVASAAYDKAIELEPDHWQARFGKAFGTSMIPEFLGQRPAAIEQFERLIEIQEAQARTPEQVQTYYRLGTLYKDAGNAKKAREMWERGLRLFPDNKTLAGALELLGNG